MLGGLQAVSRDLTITRFRTQKTGFLLAYLALYLHRSHPREQLAELFWPDEDEEAARHNLRNALSALRRQLEPPGATPGAVLSADRQAVRLNPLLVSSDATEFQALLEQARRATNATEQVLFCSAAVDLYRDELLPGCYEEWCLAERERLAEGYLDTLRRLMNRMEAAGELEPAIEYARRAVHTDPLQEESHVDLMRLLSVAGELSGALRQYHRLETVLAQELDERPSPRARQVGAHLERLTKGGTREHGTSQPAGEPAAATQARPFYATGVQTHARQDVPAARRLAEESIQHFRELGDRMGLAYALCFLGALAAEGDGEHEGAFRFLEEALGLFRALQHPAGAAYSLLLLARASRETGRPADARHLLDENLALIRRTDGAATAAERAIRKALAG